jgi:hypothetical protein
LWIHRREKILIGSNTWVLIFTSFGKNIFEVLGKRMLAYWLYGRMERDPWNEAAVVVLLLDWMLWLAAIVVVILTAFGLNQISLAGL